MVNEKTLAAASYIITFYQEVQALNQLHANYLNMLLELDYKFGKTMENLDPAIKDHITLVSQTLRSSVHKAYIAYSCIRLKVDSKEDVAFEKLVETSYNQISTDFIPERDVVTVFTVSMNKMLVNDIFTDLLKTSQSVLSDVYGDNANSE